MFTKKFAIGLCAALLVLAVFSFAVREKIFMTKNNTGLKDDINKCKTLNPDFCNKDSDCICGGKDKITGNCFLGNTDYYELCVSKNDTCADFCSGITGKLKAVCKNNRCAQT